MYSRKNLKIDPNKDPKDFFSYSFFEQGQKDAPAQIDFVRKFTGQDKITYVGHSEGNTQMWSALAENHGNLQDKLNLFVALAPAASMKYCKNKLIKFSADSWRHLAPVLETLNQYELYNPQTDKAL